MKKLVSILIICILITVYTPFAFAQTTSSGKIFDSAGENIIGEWTLDDQGTLAISGTGEMGKLDGQLNKDMVLKVVVNDGVDELFDYSTYRDFPNLKTLKILSKKFILGSSQDMMPFIVNCPNLEEIEITPENENHTTINGVAYNKNVTEIKYYPKGKKDSIYTIPETITCLTSLKNDYIEEIILHSNLEEFTYCDLPSLKKVEIPNSVKNLYLGYYDNFSLKEDGIYYLGNNSNPYLWVMGADPDITELKISDKTENIAEYAFSGCNNLKTAVIPDNIKNLGSQTFAHCLNLESIHVGSGLDYLPFGFCYGEMPKLKKITVSDNIKYVSHDSLCISGGMSEPSYDDITGNSGSHSIKASFWDLLKTFEEGSGLYYLGNNSNPYVVMFYDGFGEGSTDEVVVFPYNLKSISFGYFPNAKRLLIPKNVTNIATNAFSSCSNLTDIYYEGSKEEWDKIELGQNNDNLLNAKIHYNTVKEMYKDYTDDYYNDKLALTIGNKSACVFGIKVINDVAPIIKNSRTMLPVRFIAENLGAVVTWESSNPDIVTITKNSTKIVISIGQNYAEVNGTKVELDSAAFIENDRTYLPVRFISENLGANVEWIDTKQEVLITAK
ncbi:MAG: leucine-rich repeat protein [Clostridia bacterium]|nr:leucine-rich repeat protein [Clostridia bacterium]